MRIAISGTHYSGKTSLLEALMKAFPKYEFYEEPYHAMEEDGYEFSDPPSLEDHEAQLEYSLNLIRESAGNAFFDRGPVDFLAYAETVEGGPGGILDQFQDEIVEALETLDLIVFLPIEAPDPIPVPRSEDLEFREAVNENLQRLLEKSFVLRAVLVLELRGSLDQRLASLKQYITRT